MGIPVPIVRVAFAEECWPMSSGIESRSFSLSITLLGSHLLIKETEVNYYLVKIQAS